MDYYALPRPSAGSWIPQPDQSGYPPLRRSIHTVDLAVPPRQPPIPDINGRDPDNCHDTLRDHRRAIKSRYRRIVENQMRAEEAPHADEGLRPFRWDACEWNQPLLPELKRAMDESDRDTARAWERFDRRSSEDKVAAEVAKRERVAEVQRRVEDMIREEKERKEDEGLRELLDEIPIYRFPEMNNSIPLSSLIGNIQEQIHAPICDILITRRDYPYLQLELSQVLGWVQQDCSQHDLERVILVSSDELDRYCCLIADRIFHHTSSGFKKHNYLSRLRNAQARLRSLKKVNTDLTEENKRLQSMMEACGQSEPDWNANSFVDPSPQRLVRSQHPLASSIPPNFSNKQLYPHQLYRSTNEGEMTPRRVGAQFDTNDNNHEGINQEYQHSQRNQPYQVNNAPFSNSADTTRGFRASQINREPQGHHPMQGAFRFSEDEPEDEPEEIQSPQHHGSSRNLAYTNKARAKKVQARKARAMVRFKRSRNKPERIHEPLPEPDPVTGYGTVVGVDEVGPIYDYSNIERVTMRGGAGPYAGLEDSDDEDDSSTMDAPSNAHSSASTRSNAPPRLGNGVINKIKKFAGEDDSDAETGHGYEQGSAASTHSGVHSHSSLKFTKHGDTVTNDPNNYLWGGRPVSSSASGNSNVSQVNSTRPSRHGQRGHRGNRGYPRREKRSNSGMIAPGLMPMAPREDPYALGQQGYTFAINQPDSLPPTPTWTTIDPKTGEVTYEDGGHEPPEAQQQDDFSWNPSHPRNTPLAATFGTANVVFAPAPAITDKATSDPVGLTAKSLQKLDKQQRHRERKDSISGYIDITGSPPGSPNAPPSEPSVVANSLKRGYDSVSKQGENSLFVDDEESDKAAELIHPDVRENFINIRAAHDARPALSDFEKANKAWLAQNQNPVTYVNTFGEGNSVEVTMKRETRTHKMNEKGEYEGEDLGAVKKRYVRGHREMIEAREKEMIHASKVYREFKEMTIEERMKRLTLIRQPIRLWNGRPGAHPDDEHEVVDLPAIYKRRVEDRNRRRRMREIAAEKAKQKRQENSTNSSVHSTGTLDTLDTEGRLGDCDGLPMGNTTSGSLTPQQGDGSPRTPRQLEVLLRRALNADLTDGGSHPRASSGRSIPSNSSKQVGPRRDRPFAGGRNNIRRGSLLSGSGYSITAPRPSAPSSVTRSNFSPMPSQGSRSPIGSRDGNTRRPTSPLSDIASTVMALRNAPLGSRIYNGPSNDRSSEGTNAANDFAALLECDDSPLLMEPEDTSIPLGPMTGLAAKLYAASMERAQIRGRVVTVRLHTLPNGMPKFTPSAIASRVFGGLVQEFQLHPDSRTAVVVFIHPNEARAYVQHFRNVREKGTEQEIRELQVEVSWYKGKESESIIAHHPNLLKHNLAPRARRCILLSHIPITKKYQTVSEELSTRLGKLLLNIYFITPTQNYLKVSEGRQVMLEFASLADAVDAYDALKTGRVWGYEDAEPEYKTEGTAKRWSEKSYCGCLGCCEKREEREEKKLTDEERMRKRARRREERVREAREVWEAGGGGDVDDDVRSMSWGLGDDDDDSLVLSSVYDSESS